MVRGHLTADLFGTLPVPGLGLEEALFTPDEQDAIADHSRRLDFRPYVHQGWEGKRQVRRFGWHPGEDAQEPIPGWLLAARDRAACALGRDPHRFDQALVIRYDAGAGIGWHRDRPPYREVIGVSLGSPADLAFRRRRDDGRFDRAKVRLEPGSAYLLSGPARSEWQHGIAAHDALRFSLTFRSREGD